MSTSNKLLTVDQLSKVIHKAPSSIYSDLIRNPSSLPPSIRLPNSRRVFFPRVDEWLNAIIDATLPSPTLTEGITNNKKRLGRPTKAQQVARLGSQS